MLCRQRRDERLLRGEAAGAVQEQDRRALSGLVKLDVDVGDDTIKSVTALRWFKVGQVDMDAEFSGADILILDETFRSKFFSQELTFTLAPLGGSDPFEAEVLRLTNRARAQGWNCATLRTGGPALPPLKGSATRAASSPKRPARSTARVPFSASPSRVAAASPLRPVRRTLVAPILPDPMARRSPKPIIRVIRTPKGTDPSR